MEEYGKTLAYIPENIFTIADAKRGDIGYTSTQYASFLKPYHSTASPLHLIWGRTV